MLLGQNVWRPRRGRKGGKDSSNPYYLPKKGGDDAADEPEHSDSEGSEPERSGKKLPKYSAKNFRVDDTDDMPEGVEESEEDAGGSDSEDSLTKLDLNEPDRNRKRGG